MGFYKNTKAQILKLEGEVEYPVGILVKYDDVCAEVCPCSSNWAVDSCEKLCAFNKYCGHEIMGIRCMQIERSDHEGVYFKKVKL